MNSVLCHKKVIKVVLVGAIQGECPMGGILIFKAHQIYRKSLSYAHVQYSYIILVIIYELCVVP